MKDYFLNLFQYNFWANNLFLRSLEDKKIQKGDGIKLLCHIINAQFVWLSRISGKSDLLKPIWGFYLVEELKMMLQEDEKNWMSYFESINNDELERIVIYKNSEGKEFTNTTIEIIAHVVNHGTYHRGQIAKIIKANGYTPPSSDYIVFKRSLK